MKNLLEIEHFGAIDADNDDLLATCFEDHEAYLDLLNFKKFLIVGKKGSGKTAIFKKMLTTREHNYFCFGHTFSDYPWHFHDKQARIGIPDFDKYTHSWKYLILLTISKIILNHDYSLPFDDKSMESISKIEKFVVDTYGTRDPDIVQIFTPSKKLKLKPHIDFDISLLKAGISPEFVPMNELPTIIQEVNENLIKLILSSLSPENDYYICFDQLDLGFDPKNEQYFNRLIGLLLAARDINIAAKTENKKLFISIFLRDDIYDSLHFEDKNKLTENFASIIEWDTPRTKKTLKSLMEKRFNSLLSDNNNPNVTWEYIFDETKEMAGHQKKYTHIIDRTFLRPRDIIKFCNLVLEKYKVRISEETDKEDDIRFNNFDINLAKTEYGDYFLRELDDEIHKHIPDYKTYLEIFKSIGVVQFDRAEFIDHFEKKKGLFSSTLEPLQILKLFYEFSIIGFYRVGGKGYGGSEYIFKYKEARTLFDEQSIKFRLHYGLMDVLGLKKFAVK